MMKSPNILLIGCGKIAQEHLKALKQFHANIHGIIRKKQSTTYPPYKIHTWENLQGFDKDIDGIICSVPLKEGYKILSEKIPDHIPTLYEKPLFKDLNQLIHFQNEASEIKKNNTYIAYNRRFYNTVNKLREIISKNDSYYLEGNFSDGYNNLIKDNLSDSYTVPMYITSHWVDMIGYIIGYDKLSKMELNTSSPYHISFHAELNSKYIELTFTPDQARNHYLRLTTAKGIEYLMSPLEKLHEISLDINSTNHHNFSATKSYIVESKLIVEEDRLSHIKPGFLNQMSWFLDQINQKKNNSNNVDSLYRVECVFKLMEIIQKWNNSRY